MRAEFINNNPFKDGDKVEFCTDYYGVKDGKGKVITCVGPTVFVEITMPDCGTHVIECHYTNLKGWDRK